MGLVYKSIVHRQKMVRVRNVADAQAQIFLASEEFLLPILKTFTLFTGSLHTTGNARYFQSVYSSSSQFYTDGIHPIVLIIKLWYFVFTVKTTIYYIKYFSACYMFR
jgi:hypothetical protein